ncbi:oligosaccharide repeat unit polymerase [Apilactobacillus timberlakei]|uniref:O-antigen polymerase n=1 Tax=Apilactobacillus timberlakei TaxID=2008380 RepID=UPI00112D750E|nr:O-antigen polymerase [Apilactobacillus timberlakei]TPR24950.1 oligosaccharide repeat unit polymerase [Apilactobacillus timberlakei]
MDIFLFIFIIIIGIISFIFNRNILFPAHILITSYAVASFMLIIILKNVESDISYITFLLTILFLVIFTFFCHLGNNFGERLFFLDKSTKYSIKFIHVNNKKIIFLIAFQLLSLSLFILKFDSMLGHLNSATLTIFRLSNHYGNSFYSMPSWINFMCNISLISSFLSMYVLINNYFYNHKINKKGILLIINSLMGVSFSLVNSSRYTIFVFIIYTLCLYLFFCKITYSSKFLSSIFLSFVSFFTLISFNMLGNIIGRTNGLSNSATYYFGGGMALFDSYLKDPFPTYSLIFGNYTFSTFYKGLSKIGIGNFHTQTSLPFKSINGVSIGNVYSGLFSYYVDFGIAGIVVIAIIVGFLYGLLFNYISSIVFIKKNKNIKIVIYFYLSYTLVLFTFSETFINTFLSFGLYVNIYIMYALYKFFFNELEVKQY